MAMGLGMVTRPEKRRMEEEERLADRISSLPDGVLGEIVSLLPTKAGARTQILYSRWHHIWRSAPLNLDFQIHRDHRPESEGRIHADKVSRVLSAHPGPGRRFSISEACCRFYPNTYHAAMDGWLRSPALDKLQELDLNTNGMREYWRAMHRHALSIPASVRRFSSTFRVARFSCFDFPDGAANANALHLPLLKQLTLSDVSISESSLHTLLAGCSLLRSLLLLDNHGFSRLRIESRSLRSIGLGCDLEDVKLERLLVVDAPCLQRLLFFEGSDIHISVISAPRLNILGKLLYDSYPKLEFSTTVFQGLTALNMTTVVHSVKVLALSDVLSLDAIINLLKCFPRLEKLYIKAKSGSMDNAWYHKYWKLIGTLDIRLRKLVLANYEASNKSHVDFAKFFVSKARVLESMRLESVDGNISKDWIARQHRQLDVKKRASRGAQFNFVECPKILTGSLDVLQAEQVHDLSTTDPFLRFHQYI